MVRIAPQATNGRESRWAKIRDEFDAKWEEAIAGSPGVKRLRATGDERGQVSVDETVALLTAEVGVLQDTVARLADEVDALREK